MILFTKTFEKKESKIKKQSILSSLFLNGLGIYLRDGPFGSDIGAVNLHPTKGTHWVAYIAQKYFDLYGCSVRFKLSKFIVKRNGYCLYSEHKTQGLTRNKKILIVQLIVYI